MIKLFNIRILFLIDLELIRVKLESRWWFWVGFCGVCSWIKIKLEMLILVCNKVKLVEVDMFENIVVMCMLLF